MDGNLYIDNIDLDFLPRQEIVPKLTKIKGEPEMTEFESAFLCGVLRRFEPKKIVEVGIAGGGTTAIVLQSAVDIGKDFELHSIDYSEQFYRDRSYQSGFLGIEAKKILGELSGGGHQYHLGNVACEFMDEIGGDVDCVILDTIHLAPGEVLEFITILPWLKDGCVVILHDTIFSHICRYRDKYRYATTLLLSAVSADKYINMDNSRAGELPNIAAFVVGEKTRENIADLFLSLIVTWNFMPYAKQLDAYRKCIETYYDAKLLKIYDSAVLLNRNTFYQKDQNYAFPFLNVPDGSRIVLYGAGCVGTVFMEQIAKNRKIKVVLWADMRWEVLGKNVESIEKIREVQYDFVVIAIENEKIATEAKQKLMELDVPANAIIWKRYKRL